MKTETDAKDAARDVVRSFSKLIDILFEETHRKIAVLEMQVNAVIPATPRARWVSKKQLAVHLGVVPRTVDNWMKRVRVPYVKLGRTVRFNLEDVDKHLRSERLGG